MAKEVQSIDITQQLFNLLISTNELVISYIYSRDMVSQFWHDELSEISDKCHQLVDQKNVTCDVNKIVRNNNSIKDLLTGNRLSIHKGFEELMLKLGIISPNQTPSISSSPSP